MWCYCDVCRVLSRETTVIVIVVFCCFFFFCFFFCCCNFERFFRVHLHFSCCDAVKSSCIWRVVGKQHKENRKVFPNIVCVRKKVCKFVLRLINPRLLSANYFLNNQKNCLSSCSSSAANGILEATTTIRKQGLRIQIQR